MTASLRTIHLSGGGRDVPRRAHEELLFMTDTDALQRYARQRPRRAAFAHWSSYQPMVYAVCFCVGWATRPTPATP